VARTSADWFQGVVLAHAELLGFPATKTRFHKPDGSLGPEPTNGICLIAKGEIACEALRRSRLGYCLIVDRTAVSSMRVSASAWVDPDDAPEWTDEMFARADLYHGDKLIRRGRRTVVSRKDSA
jgi:hypothetical protein